MSKFITKNIMLGKAILCLEKLSFKHEEKTKTSTQQKLRDSVILDLSYKKCCMKSPV